jgi:mycofactocin system FadH/OYE family oxidoreductase 1
VSLLTPLPLGRRQAPNRVLFGPHVTNLGRGRALSERHVAYYRRRAEGGCGTIVVEEASVHDSDWPYERSPLASECGDGWAAVVGACRPLGSLVVAALGHAGGQGSSAYSQRELWAPSRVPEVNTREVPKWMEADDIAAVVAGFAASAKVAVDAGCDGVEVNAGQHSLVRQFLSGLTNQRDDEWGGDRTLFARQVLTAVRGAAGDGIVGLRFSGDELAPWAGITPEQAPPIAAVLAEWIDYIVVVRGAIFSVEKTRPDFHEPTNFNVELCRAVRSALPARVAVVLQGSVVDPAEAADFVAGGVADAVEMTRAQIADPDLVRKTAARDAVRPCIRCNQTCQVRDARNPVVTCVGEPTSGRETEDPDWYEPATARAVTVVGAGPAGLECARVALTRGHRVRIVEQRDRTGGVAAVAGPGAALVAWLEAECRRLGATIELSKSHRFGTDSVQTAATDTPAAAEGVWVMCTGGRPGARTYEADPDAVVVDVVAFYEGAAVPDDGSIVVHDPIGGPIAVAVAERLGSRAVLVTPDLIAGNELSRSGDLAPANVRLQQIGVRIEKRAILRSVHADHVEVDDRFTGARRRIDAVAVVDCGYRLPANDDDASRPLRHVRAGDCVAPRTIHEAILEGRRAALAIDRF